MPQTQRWLVMANGAYGNDSEEKESWYREESKGFHKILCADGGTNHARRFGIHPDFVVGDMDSIDPKEQRFMEEQKVAFHLVPAEKDITDTQLALDIAARGGAGEIVIWGGAGDRLDHTLANLLSAVPYAKTGIHIRFDSPELTIHLVKDERTLQGTVGDTVTVLSLLPEAKDVTLTGFYYPLKHAALDAFHPVGVSNLMTEETAHIRIGEGILAVFHMKSIV